MTIQAMIERVDRLKPNQVSEADKIQWLSDCDRYLFSEIISRHEPDAETPDSFDGYGAGTNLLQTSLLAPPPHDELYVFYLYMQIDMVNQELDKYNNSMVLFQNSVEKYGGWYKRNHMPIMGVAYYTL